MAEVVTLTTRQHDLVVLATDEAKDEIDRLATDLDGLGLTIEREHLIREHTRHAFSGFQPEGEDARSARRTRRSRFDSTP